GPLVVATAVLLVSSSVVAAHRWPVNLDGSSSEAPLADVGAVQPAPTAPFVPEPVPVVETTSDGASAPAAEEASPAVSGAAVAVVAPVEPDAGVGVEAEGVGEAANDALTAAISQGSEALTRLAEQYPNDPKVLRALAMDH